jgi:hypothetical protein
VTVLGPWQIPDGDPVLADAQAAFPLLRPKVIDAFALGEITLQSIAKPKRAPAWAWGFAPSRRELWVDAENPYVIAAYVCNHELGHSFDSKFLDPVDRSVLMTRMGVSVPIDATDAQIQALWARGSYTAKSCFVPREGFADAFAKAQAQAPGAPDDPKANGFVNVLPHFYKVNIAPADFPWFLSFIKVVA